MNARSKKRIFSIIFLSLLFLCMCMLPLQAKNKKTVRVGYPLMNGLSMKDKDGNYYGYDYDYLMQISQYTGWEYEFVEVKGNANQRITKLMDMLEKGEIDLLGDTKYIESLTASYDYASEPYGNAYNIIAVKDDSDILDTNGLVNKKGLKIGVLKSASKRELLLEQYAQTNGFAYEKVTCDDSNDMMNKLDNNEIDAFLYVDLSLPEHCHSIARFSPDPFFFITTKGNTQIMSDLNRALTTINSINPTLPSTLYNRYFGGDTSTFTLNSTENTYIKEHKDVNVLVRGGFAPIQYMEDKNVRGIGKDILKSISKNTGIQFHYTYAKDYEEYKKLANSDDIDILMSLPYGSKIANTMHVTLTEPFLSSNLSLITYKNINPSKLSSLKQGTTLYNNELYDTNKKLSYYETPEDLLHALNRHEIDYAYLNNYTYMYYMNMYNYKNTSSFGAPEHLRSQYAFGVVESDDFTLLGILNKAIRSQSADIDTYIYKNAYAKKQFVLKEFLIEHIVSVISLTLCVILLIIYFINRYYKKQLWMKKSVEIENKRYQMLSDLSGEMTFSYDYARDYFKVSNSGIGKLSKDAFIFDFSTTSVEQIHAATILHTIQSYLLEKKDIVCEVENSLLFGNSNWYQISIKIIEDVEKNKKTAVYAVGKIIDIQKEKIEKEQLRIQSETDTLTGILNRGAIEKKITKLLQEEKGIGALIMVDLDNFKMVNDDYGHLEGDKVLMETARILTSIFVHNPVARLGGDEFIAYVPNVDEKHLQELCDETLKRFRSLSSMENKNITLSISMGIAYTTNSKDFMELLKQADVNLYEVKRNGRNNFLIS